MSNLKPAPFSLTPQVVRSTLGIGHAKGMTSIRFIAVDHDSEMSAPIAASELLARQGSIAGFWRVRVKANEIEPPIASEADHDRGGVADSTPPCPPVAPVDLIEPRCIPDAHQSRGGNSQSNTTAALAPPSPTSASWTEAPEPVAHSNPAGSGDRGSAPVETVADNKTEAVQDGSRDETITQIIGEGSETDRADRAGCDHDRAEARNLVEDGSACRVHRSTRPHDGGRTKPSVVSTEAADLKPAKPEYRDWMAERRQRIEAAIAFLKSKAILVTQWDKTALVARYRVSGKRELQYAEEVIEKAMEMGWQE